MPLSLDQFCDQLVALGLANETTLGPLRAKVASDDNPVQSLARVLVKEKRLTAYQAQTVYAGRGKSLSLGKHIVLDKIGEGGMGQVFKARHRTMDRIEAIKLLPPELTDSAEAIARFHREVRAAARLEHANIVRAYDADEHQGAHFLVMEYVSGDDLSARVRSKGAMTVEQAVDCVRQAARGLEFAHARGIIHRDIKPSNMLLDEHGVLRILDMGLARVDSLDESTHSELTSTGQVMGTVDYMAPEQALDTKMVDGRADIYSLGVTLYFLLSARPMYEADTMVKKLMAHQTADVPRLTSIRGDVPVELDRIFQKMVAKKPEDRYPTMTALLEDLDRWNTSGEGLASPGPSRGELTAFDEFLKQAPFASASPRSTKPLGPTIQIGLPQSAGDGASATARPMTGNDDVTHVWTRGDEDTDPQSSFSISVPERPDKAATARPKPNRASPRPIHWIALGTLLPILLVAGVIVILIRNKDGSETKIEVPDDAEVLVIRPPTISPSPVKSPTTGTVVPESTAAAPWEHLFADGQASGWKTLGPFSVQGGLLVATDGAANAISAKYYTDFEFEAEWRLGPNGNSGIYYREPATDAIVPGNEYQLLDDAAYTETQPPTMRTGSLYGMLAPSSVQSRPIGQWNNTKIVCRGTQVEHWLNGTRVVQYDTASAEWKRLVEASTFKGKAAVGTRPSGRILLQGHTGDIAFRLIRIRPMESSNPAAGAIETLRPLAGNHSLVPRPQFIPGLKSWDIVRPIPVAWCAGIECLPDGRFVTSWYTKPGIHIHDTDLRVQQLLLADYRDTGGTLGFAVAPRRGLVASYDRTPRIRIWEINTGATVFQSDAVGWNLKYNALCFSHDEQRLVAIGDSLLVFDLSGEESPREMKINDNNQTYPRSLLWSTDDSQIWLATTDRKFAAYDANDLTPITDHALNDMELSFLSASPDAKRLVAALNSGEIRVYDVANWKIARQWKLDAPADVDACAWSPDQSQIAFSTGSNVEVWDVMQQKRLSTTSIGGRLAWSADGHALVRISIADSSSSKINPITGAEERIVWSPEAHTTPHSGISISPDGSLVARSGDYRVALFDAETGTQITRRVASGSGTHSRFSTDSQDVAIDNYDGYSTLQRISDGQQKLKLSGTKPELSPNGVYVATQSQDGKFAIWNTGDGTLFQEFSVPSGEAISARWSPNNRLIAVRVGNQQTTSALHIWDTQDRSLRSRTDFPATTTRNFPPIGPIWKDVDRLLVSFGGRVFEISAGDLSQSTTWTTTTLDVYGLAFSPLSKRSMMLDNGSVWLIDETGKAIKSMRRSWWAPLYDLPDGRRFASSGNWFYDYPARGFDSGSMHDLGCLFPSIGQEGWLTIGPTGHYQGSEGIESEFLYVAEHLDGHQQTYTPAEFAKAFNWKNNPQQATFLKLVETTLVLPTADSVPRRADLLGVSSSLVRFADESSRVEVPKLDFDMREPWTIEAWVQLGAGDDDAMRVIGKCGPVYLTTYRRHWQLLAAHTDQSGAGKWGAAVNGPHINNQAFHFAGQWTGDVLQLFLNGDPITTDLMTWGSSDPVDQILSRLFSDAQYPQLIIGNVEFENRAQFLGDIAAFRISRTVRYKKPFIPDVLRNDADTIALYDFSQGSGDVLKDISGHGHDGKIIGATWVTGTGLHIDE